jgi:hypothetical protein
MSKDLIDQPVGKEGLLKLKVENGKLVFEVVHNHASGNVLIHVEQDPKYFAQLLKQAIPGSIDDFFIDQFVAAVEAL